MVPSYGFQKIIDILERMNTHETFRKASMLREITVLLKILFKIKNMKEKKPMMNNFIAQ